ncbi:MAG: secreted trypsin-like serine protease [Myxococcales bacterium]|nr:secreted trypsin-like serine protease [Myxococcales bacterium]
MLRTISVVLFLSSSAFASGTAPSPVVGGTAPRPGEWPDAVVVVASNALCTGTLIAPDVVLTAGHCIDIHPLEVVANTIDYSQPGGEAMRVKSATAYPDWENHYDVGVLVLEHPLSVKPRAVASACKLAGASVRLVGFGLTTKSGTGHNSLLQQAMLPVIDYACTKDPGCATAVAPNGEFTAGGRGTDSCFGDSGGPLYIDTPHGAAVIGVVSRGESAAGQPCGGGGIYVRADKVIPWVEKVTGRKIERAACDAPADEIAAADEAGCSVGGGALGGGLLVVLGVLWLLTIPRRVPR